MSQEEEVVLLRSFSHPHEGEFARSTLEAAGIDSALLEDDTGWARLATSFSNPARLLVRREDVAEAQVVLEAAGMYP